MIDLSVRNFRGVSRARLTDDKPLSVIVGANRSGKTSLAQAIAYAFCASVGEIKDVGLLVRQGEDDLRVSLNLPGWTLERSLAAGGPKVSEVAARMGNIPLQSLPLLFESSACLRHSAHLVAFLNSLDEIPPDSTDILNIDPEARSLFLDAMKAVRGKLRSCIYHANDQKERIAPRPAPVAPREIKPAGDDLEEMRRRMERATALHNKSLDALRDFSSRKERLRKALEWYRAQENFEASMQEAQDDVLGAERLSLERLCKIELKSLIRTGQELKGAMREDLSDALALLQTEIEAAKEDASEALSMHPRAAIAFRPEPLPETIQAELQRSEVTSRSSLEAILIRLDETPFERQVRQTQQKLSEIQSAMIKLERNAALWDEYQIALGQHARSEMLRQQRRQAWNRVAQAVQSYLTQRSLCARDEIERMIKRCSKSLLGDDNVSVDPYGRLLVRGLCPSLLSASEIWRLGVGVMASIGSLAKSPILLVDGADILDDRNRITLIKWLLAEICPHFAHTILLSTARGDKRDRAPLAFNATQWWIEDGYLAKV
jgi:AAA domain